MGAPFKYWGALYVCMTESYYQSDKLKDRIDWKNIMPMSRYAGGHDDQMRGLLKNVTVIAHYNEGDYQGMVATCVKLNDTKEIAIYNDFYGSCSGCDAWEDATDDDVKRMCIQLACSALLFKNIKDCKEFLSSPCGDSDFNWCYSDVAGNLLKNVVEKKVD